MITPTQQIVWSIVSRQPIADLSPTSRQPVADQSQPISNQLAINRPPVADLSPTGRRFLDRCRRPVADCNRKMQFLIAQWLHWLQLFLSRKAVSERLQYMCDRGLMWHIPRSTDSLWYEYIICDFFYLLTSAFEHGDFSLFFKLALYKCNIIIIINTHIKWSINSVQPIKHTHIYIDMCIICINGAFPHKIQISIYISYTLGREYRVMRNRYSRLLFTSEDHLCANLRVQEQSTNMTSQC